MELDSDLLGKIKRGYSCSRPVVYDKNLINNDDDNNNNNNNNNNSQWIKGSANNLREKILAWTRDRTRVSSSTRWRYNH